MRLGPGLEFDLIRAFLEGAASGPGVRVGAGDDCTVVAGHELAVSADMSMEGVHFRREWLTPEEIGARAVLGALSDLAAIAALPIGALVSLAVTESDVPDYAVRLMRGARSAIEDAGGALVGGDVTRSTGPLVVDTIVIGETARPILRAGAEAGHALFVTGTLGGAATAVRDWLRGRAPGDAARAAFARPQPRLREARWLASRELPHALIDLSDGLAGDAAHIAAASDVRIVIDAQAVPVHAALRAAVASEEEQLRLALAGGEDYELCFAAEAEKVERVRAAFESEFGVPLTRVGSVQPGSGVELRRADGTVGPIGLTSYRHFEERLLDS